MTNLVLDTNIYTGNPARNDLNFKSLEKLARNGFIKLHMPYIIEREFQTQQRKLCEDDLKKTISGLNGLIRKQLSSHVMDGISDIKNKLEEDKESILQNTEIQLTNWVTSIGGNRYPLCLEQAENAFEAYFKGTVPFKEPKIRKDIPDSFIVQSIKKLCSINQNMHIVVGDNKVRDSFIETTDIKTYEKLSDFINSSLIQGKLIKLDLIEKIELIKEATREYEDDNDDISSKIRAEIGDQLLGKIITDYSILDDNHEATISGYYDADDVELLFDQINYHGSGQFGIPFNLKINVTAYYYIFKSDYYMNDENKPSVSDLNDHYFEAEDEFYISVEGIVSLSIDIENIDFEAFHESINEDLIAIDEITDIEKC